MTGDDFDYEDEYEELDPERPCHTCHGDGYGVIGEDWPARDIDLGREGEIEKCPNCCGSGLETDCWFW